MPEEKKQEYRDRLLITLLRVLSPIVVIAILVARAQWPTILTDPITLTLIIVALLPLLMIFIDYGEFFGAKVHFKRIEARQEQQEYQIRTLQFLVENFISRYELEHLNKLNDDKQDFLFKNDWQAEFFRPELSHLRSLGLIESKENKSLREMFDRKEANVKEYFSITPKGQAYLEILKVFEKQVRSSRDKITVAGTSSERSSE